MLDVQRRSWGFAMRFEGPVDLERIEQWGELCARATAGAPRYFGVILEMHDATLACNEAVHVVTDVLRGLQAHGLVRAVIVERNELLVLHGRRVAQHAGLYGWMRFVDGESERWMDQAKAWILDHQDPDRLAA